MPFDLLAEALQQDYLLKTSRWILRRLAEVPLEAAQAPPPEVTGG